MGSFDAEVQLPGKPDKCPPKDDALLIIHFQGSTDQLIPLVFKEKIIHRLMEIQLDT